VADGRSMRAHVAAGEISKFSEPIYQHDRSKEFWSSELPHRKRLRFVGTESGFISRPHARGVNLTSHLTATGCPSSFAYWLFSASVAPEDSTLIAAQMVERSESLSVS